LAILSCTSNNQEFALTATVAPTITTDHLITLHYNERPPYLITSGSGVEGLTGTPATLVFQNMINIPFQWKQTPSKRQLYLLEQNRGRDCLVGWFKLEEREKYAKYTLPIYQDRPQIALARADNNKISSGSVIDDIFSNPQLTLLVKDGYSYGDFLDKKIKDSNPSRTVTTVENSIMLKMIYAKHADYFFVSPEEANGLINTSEFDLQDFKFVQFSDIPFGEERYILCSMQIEDVIIEELNSVIRQHIVISSQ